MLAVATIRFLKYAQEEYKILQIPLLNARIKSFAFTW